MERRLAAIMAADVVGYSRLIRADEEGTIVALKALRANVIDPKIAEHNGRIVKLMGDGMLAEFASVVDAVRSAVETQVAVAEHNSDLPEDKRIEFRVGINLGDVVIDGDDIHGDGVNIAARLEALSESGGICISGKVYEEVRDRTDLAFEDMGEQMVKNIDRPIRVWRWTTDTSATASGPATTDQPLPLPDKPSIAVLPFDNMSGDPEQEYFVDGITEDIITALSKFHSFLVIARNSTFTYKGRAVNVGDVGKELGVRYVVEGSIRKAGNRVRITAQLVEAISGNHVWAEHYDRDLEDIFVLQDEITETIVGAVEQEIGSVERTRATQKHPDSLEAWELLQRGLHHVWQMNREGLQIGVNLLRQSVAKDPGFAQAHSQLAFTLMHQVFLGTADNVDQTLLEAQTHTNEALIYDDRDSLAHEMHARILITQQKFDEAVMEAKRAVQFNPNSASANFALSTVCFFADRSSEGLESVDRSIRFSPKDPRHYSHILCKGAILCEIGRAEEGIELLKQAVSIPHGDYRPALFLACYSAEIGSIDEAQKAAARLLELNPDFTLTLFETKLSGHFHPDLKQRTINHLNRLDLPK